MTSVNGKKSTGKRIHLIRVGKKLIRIIADKLELCLFNKTYKILETFDVKKEKEFERFRSAHVQAVIQYLLNKEFDISNFVETGLIIDHFPIHNFIERDDIWDYWKKRSRDFLVASMFFKPSNPATLRPLTAISHYFGSKVHQIA